MPFVASYKSKLGLKILLFYYTQRIHRLTSTVTLKLFHGRLPMPPAMALSIYKSNILKPIFKLDTLEEFSYTGEIGQKFLGCLLMKQNPNHTASYDGTVLTTADPTKARLPIGAMPTQLYCFHQLS